MSHGEQHDFTALSVGIDASSHMPLDESRDDQKPQFNMRKACSIFLGKKTGAIASSDAVQRLAGTVIQNMFTASGHELKDIVERHIPPTSLGAMTKQHGNVSPAAHDSQGEATAFPRRSEN